MNRLAKYRFPKARLQCVGNDQIHRPMKKLLKKVFEIHIRIEGFPVELYQEIEIALRCVIAAHRRTKQAKPPDAETADLFAIPLQRAEDQLETEVSSHASSPEAPGTIRIELYLQSAS
jgi:hypothetical protein